MADCNVSIDQENLPGVKEVCRDFAVLEDHCLAYNLQEQEIESHLASNVHKSRLVQQDLQVAKKLQEEEDLRAKAQKKRHQSTIERQDGEIAHEIQEELVRQEEQQREQEEKDAAIARKLHEKEIKEERKRQKHVEPSEDDEYVEDQGASLPAAREPLDLDKPKYRSLSPSRQDAHLNSYNSPEYSSTEPKRSRHPKGDPVSPHSRSRYPEHFLETEGSRGRRADPYPDPLLPSRGKQRNPDNVPSETGWSHTADSERMVRKKERPTRPFPTYRERDTGWEWDRETDRDRQYNRHERRGRQEERRHRDEEWPRDRGLSADRLRDQEHHRLKDPDRTRTRSRDRVLDEDYYDNRHRRDRPSWEYEEVERERRARDRRRMDSNPDDVFEEHSARNRKESSELWEPHKREGPARERGSSHPSTETGHNLHKRNGAVEAESDYRLTEATKGMTKLDIHEQELKDREVARKLQEEELRKNSTISRAAQVAQDEEIARLMMEQEKKEYKKQREREKERQREKEREKERERHDMDRMAADRKRQEAEYRPYGEDVVRPRTRDEYEYQRQKNHHKPTRPPQPRPQEYANMNPAYGYPDQAGPPRAPSRPEPTSRGAYYKR